MTLAALPIAGLDSVAAKFPIDVVSEFMATNGSD